MSDVAQSPHEYAEERLLYHVLNHQAIDLDVIADGHRRSDARIRRQGHLDQATQWAIVLGGLARTGGTREP